MVELELSIAGSSLTSEEIAEKELSPPILEPMTPKLTAASQTEHQNIERRKRLAR